MSQHADEAESDMTTLLQLLTLNRAYQEVLQDKIDDMRRLLAQNKRQQVGSFIHALVFVLVARCLIHFSLSNSSTTTIRKKSSARRANWCLRRPQSPFRRRRRRPKRPRPRRPSARSVIRTSTSSSWARSKTTTWRIASALTPCATTWTRYGAVVSSTSSACLRQRWNVSWRSWSSTCYI